MQTRAMLATSSNDNQRQNSGMQTMDQLQYEANVTVGDSTLTASSLLAGVVNRTGPTGNYTDTLPTVAQLIAACPVLSVGDSFNFLLRNTVAFTNTIAVGTGWTLGSNTAMIASNVREYMVTIKAVKTTRVIAAASTNASPILTGLSDADVKNVEPGMVVAGTGMPASGTIIAVNVDNNTITLSGNATATASLVAVTCDPAATLEGVRTSAL